MKVLGIDPGTATTGWGVVELVNNQYKLIAHGTITTSKNLELSDRLEIIYNELEILIQKYKPQKASVELLYFSKNVKTAISVSHARGVILLCLKKNKIPFSEFQPNVVKQALTGSGKADKKQIQNTVKMILNLADVPKPDDAADAIAIAITGINTAFLIK